MTRNRTRNRGHAIVQADHLTIRTMKSRGSAYQRRDMRRRAVLAIIIAAIALAFLAWTMVSAAPSTDPPVCPPGVTCEPLGTPPAPPMPGVVFLPVVMESYP